MSDTKQRIDEAEAHAKEMSRFMRSALGQRLLSHLSVRYNALHQEAEQTNLNSEQKAFLIERAAGLKLVIDDLQSPGALLEAGYFEQ